ncbi:MAG: SPFH domain-containing protein [Planctomycetota bacterium]
MTALSRTLGFAAFFALAGLGGAKATIRISPETIGVRASKWGGGIEPRDFGCGMYLALPGRHDWYLLEAGSQTLDFGPNPAHGERASLEIRTLDNNTVKVEATVTFRIRPGEGHSILREGLETEYKSRAASTVEDVLRAELRNLSSEDWFDTDRRRTEVARIEPLIESAFAELHLELGHVLIHNSSFPAAFEEKLQEKQVYNQLALLENAKRGVQDAEAEAGMISMETESAEKRDKAEAGKLLQEAKSTAGLAISEIVARAKRYDGETRAQADLEYERLVVEGQSELDRAKAEGERLRLEALATPGGRVYLAREAARNLNIDSVELDASDPRMPLLLDLDQLSDLLIGDTE